MVIRRWMLTLVILGLGLMVAQAPILAGTWYLSDESGYWWYVDGDPEFEVLLPSNADVYMEYDWGGLLHVGLKVSGPTIIVGMMSTTDVKAAFEKLAGAWSGSLTNTRTTTDSVITTDRGLSARFLVLTGNGVGGARGMIRMVSFTKGNRMAYLLFVGDEKEFAGDYRQIWLKAVHSFSWT